MAGPTLTQADLDQFHGSETVYQHPLQRRYSYTEGIRFLARRGNAYWLLDLIFSHQISPQVRAEEFQVWRLVVTGTTAVATCTDGDTDTPIIHQDIPYTDFPLPTVELWLENDILMLPSER